MRVWVRELSLGFAAGAAGGALVWLAAWASARQGLLGLLALPAALMPGAFAPHLAWHGLFGLALLLPRGRSWPLRGLLAGLVPFLASVLFFLPRQGHGYLGLDLGLTAPLWALGLAALWGLVASFWLRLADR